VGGFHRLATAVDVTDDTRGVYYEGRAFGHAQETEHPVLAGDFLSRITQQREGEAQFRRKSAVGFRLVDADTQYPGSRALKIGKTILVCLEFLRSAWRVGVNVECQDDTVLAAEITQPNQASQVVRQFKIRCRVSNV
jgi:hypothetical protein